MKFLPARLWGYSINRRAGLKKNDPVWKNNSPNTLIGHRELKELTAR